MIVRSTLKRVAVALSFGFVAAAPAAAIDFAQGGKSFETLMKEGFRIAAASPAPGFVVPLLILTKDGTPDVFMCFQQFRDCVRLVDSPNNLPPGVVVPGVPQAPSR